MARLSFCTDEHVPHAYVTALESNGFSAVSAFEARGDETADEALLDWCANEERVLVSNDRDFVELDLEVDHAGLVVYTTQTLSPGEFVRGIRRIDRQFAPESIRNTLVWLENWL